MRERISIVIRIPEATCIKMEEKMDKDGFLNRSEYIRHLICQDLKING